MPNFSRAELITTLTMMMGTIDNDSDTELRRTVALSMFEVILRYYDLFTQGKMIRDSFTHVMIRQNKGLKMISDLRSMFINSRNSLGRHPCADRQDYLNVSLSF